MRVRIGFALAALVLAGAGGPDVTWVGYDNALQVSAISGKPVCLLFTNDKVELNGST